MTLEILTWILLSWYVIPVAFGLISMLMCMVYDLYYHGTVFGKDNKPLIIMFIGAFVPIVNIVVMAVSLVILIQYTRDL